MVAAPIVLGIVGVCGFMLWNIHHYSPIAAWGIIGVIIYFWVGIYLSVKE